MAAAGLLVLVSATALVGPAAELSQADGAGGRAIDGNPQCDGNGTTVIGSANNGDPLATYSAPAGTIVTAVCIKSGANMFGALKHSFPLQNGTYENGCYQVSGVGSGTVTVTRLLDGSSCQGISHIDAILGDAQVDPTSTPTATPTATPTPTLTATPTGTVTTTATPTGTSTSTTTTGSTPTGSTPSGSTPSGSTPTGTATAPVTSTQGGQTGTTPTASQSTVAGVSTPLAPRTGAGQDDQAGQKSLWVALLGAAAVLLFTGGTLMTARRRGK